MNKKLIFSAAAAFAVLAVAGCGSNSKQVPPAVVEGSKTLNLPVGPGLPPREPGGAAQRK